MAAPPFGAALQGWLRPLGFCARQTKARPPPGTTPRQNRW